MDKVVWQASERDDDGREGSERSWLDLFEKRFRVTLPVRGKVRRLLQLAFCANKCTLCSEEADMRPCRTPLQRGLTIAHSALGMANSRKEVIDQDQKDRWVEVRH